MASFGSFFNTISTWLVWLVIRIMSFWVAVGNIFKKTFGFLSRHFFLLVTGFIMVCFKIVRMIITFINEVMPQAASMLSGQTEQLTEGGLSVQEKAEGLGVSIFGWIERFNYVIPIDFTLTCLVYLFVWMVICSTYRLIKSWLPTLSG